MGRKAKYATVKQYQPYIDAIRKDLNIPDDFYIEVKFQSFSGASGGYANYRRRLIALEKSANKHWTIAGLMHEFMHIQQYLTGRLKNVFIDPVFDENTGKIKKNTGVWKYKWNNILYTRYSASKTAYKNEKYKNQPWEIEAQEYEKEIYRLFPGLEIPRIFIGQTSDGTKLYKVTKY